MVVQNLLDELAEEVNMLEMVREDGIFASPKRATFQEDDDEARTRDLLENERIGRLKERIEEEVADLAKKRAELYREVWKVATPLGDPTSSIGGMAADDHSVSGETNDPFSAPAGMSSFAFLHSDPVSSTNKRDSISGISAATRQADRRSRNAAASGGPAKGDEAFVRQIQESLLTEVRRLQSENKELMELIRKKETEHEMKIEEVSDAHRLEEAKLKSLVRDQGE